MWSYTPLGADRMLHILLVGSKCHGGNVALVRIQLGLHDNTGMVGNYMGIQEVRGCQLEDIVLRNDKAERLVVVELLSIVQKYCFQK